MEGDMKNVWINKYTDGYKHGSGVHFNLWKLQVRILTTQFACWWNNQPVWN